MIRDLLAAAALLAGLADPAHAQTASPSPGIYGGLRDSVRWLVKTQFQPQGDVISLTLGQALQRSRNEARSDSRPMPERVRKALSPFFDAQLLETVRYRVGDTSQAGIAGFAIRSGNAAAVTLIDTVVFKEDQYASDLELWAHEIHHVEQFRDWGVNGFAARYAFGWGKVEAEAEARAGEFSIWYKAARGK
jgi:hypothetical protein